ncbi:MAG: dienelactone hydrolase family protein [Holosporaceae bacterium]|jgi:phospholipase/carboxylesterase|nr:dienelactone hydrolase family protein [Holosporaceae bacterium]
MEKIRDLETIIIEADEPVQKIMFVFHGYGADNENVAPLGVEIAKNRPDIEIYVPNGVKKCEDNDGRQWFSFREPHPESYKKNEKIIQSYIDGILARKKMKYADVIFCGFSQGAMVSLTLGLKLGVDMIISFAGSVVLGEYPTVPNSRNTKVAMLHGKHDNIVPFSLVEQSIDIIRSNGTPVHFGLDKDAGHVITEDMLHTARTFFEKYA